MTESVTRQQAVAQGKRAFSAALLLAHAGAAFADKYGLDESMSSRSNAGGNELLIVLKWALVGAGAGLVVARSSRKRLDTAGSILLGGFLGLLLSLPLHAVFGW